MTTVNEGIRRVCSWVWRIAQVNVFWLLFTVAGLVVFGLLPASAAAYQIVRDLVADPQRRDEPLLRRYWQLVRTSAVRANAVGWAMSGVGFALYSSASLVLGASGQPWQIPALAVTAPAVIAFVCTVVHLPFFAAHIAARPFALLRASCLYGLTHPLATVIVLGAAVALSFALGAFPSAALFFSFSPLVFLTVVLDLRGYARLQYRATVVSAR